MISCFFQDAEVMFCGFVPHPLLASIVMSLKEKTQVDISTKAGLKPALRQ